ncbi:MAG: fascin domain-containing protein [Paraclostridium sp.]
MKNRYDKSKNEHRNPGGVIVFPPFIPGQGPGPVIPPWIKPDIPPFPSFPQPPKPEKEKLEVKIKSVSENSFIMVDYYNDYLYAGDNWQGQQVKFKLIILDGNRVKIKAEGGNFVRVDDRDFLVADTDRKGATKFNIYQVNNKEYVLQAPNGYYVRVRDKDKRLVARAENPGPRTRLKFVVID